MQPIKKQFIVSGLFIIALFSFVPLKADLLPTETTITYGYCSSVSPYGQGADSAPLVDGTGARADCLAMTVQSVTWNGHACTATGTGTLGSQMKAQGYFEGGYHCPTYTTDPYLFLLVANYIEYTQTESTCPSGYTLNGTMCEQDVNTCSFDSPMFTSTAQTAYSTLCVTQPDGSHCEYQTAVENSGTANGWNYTPTSESCGCDPLGTIPCVDSTQGATLSQNIDGCIDTGGMSFCPADPEERCSDVGGYTQCETNCGYINDVFMCGDITQPDADVCTATDTRPECTGLSEGDCPTGYDCSGTNDNTTDAEPCVTNDTRPSCEGRPVGSLPDIDMTGVEALLQQGNRNTQGILDALNSNLNPTQSITNKRNNNNAQADAADSQEINDINSELEGESGFFDTIGANNGYFSSFVTSLIPSTTAGCDPYSMDWSGSVVVMDICTEASYIKTIMAWLLNVLLAWYAFVAFTSRSSPEVK